MSKKIADVAKIAGVSISTVSRIINKSGYVSEKTRKKVLKAIEEVGYKPSQVASYLASKRNSFNCVVIGGNLTYKSITQEPDEFYTVILKGIQDYCNNNNMNLDVKKIGDDIKGYDGYILIGGEITEKDVQNIRFFNKPIVVVDQYLPSIKVDFILTDGFDAGVYAVRYLYERGIRRIYHIRGPLAHTGFKDRYEGYSSAMEELGYFPKCYEFNEQIDNTDEILDKAFAEIRKPQAFFCCNDTAARRVILSLKKRKIKVPEEISVIGFDDILSASIEEPELTTFKIFKYEMGDIAAKRLFNLLIKEDTHPVKTYIFTEFIKRGSSI